MQTEKKTQSQQKRLMFVVVILVWILALRFLLLLSNAQKNLDYIANQIRTEQIIITKPVPTATGMGIVITWDSESTQ